MAGPAVRKFPEESLEAKVYNLVERHIEYLPVENDRNRFAYSIVKYIQGEGDEPLTLVKSLKLNIRNISAEELASKITSEVESLRK